MNCGTPKNILSVSQLNLTPQEKILICPRCLGVAHGHGSRKRHVIRNGQKYWYRVPRGLCVGKCKRSFTVLLPFMLPHKYYSGPEIEKVLSAFEEGATVNSVETSAEESTIQRWKQQFHSLIPILSEQLEELAHKFFHKETSLSTLPERPLWRLKRALGLVEEPNPHWTILARSFFWALAHPLCIG